MSFELDTTSTSDQVFESKEAGKGHPPVLVISTATPATTTTEAATTTTEAATTTTDPGTTTTDPGTTTTEVATTTTAPATTTSLPPPTSTVPPPSTTSTTGTNDRFIVRCDSDHTATIDPIVYPGQSPAGHEHRFSGNRTTNESSTPESLSAAYAYAGGVGTSCELGPNGGDAEDTGAYWHPTLLVDGVVDNPASTKAYYERNNKSRSELQAPPFGLKIVAGTSSSMMAQPTTVAYWGCGTNSGISSKATSPTAGV